MFQQLTTIFFYSDDARLMFVAIAMKSEIDFCKESVRIYRVTQSGGSN